MKNWKKVKIVFTKSKKRLPIFSWFIRLWTWKPFSHVALEVPVSFLKRPMYWQANEGKVNYEYADNFDREHEITHSYEISIHESIYSKMKTLRLMAAGENYGYLQNIGIVLVDIAKLLGFNIKNPWKKGRNCSELLYVYVLKPMFPELNYNPDTIKPHHIDKIIKEKYDV